MSNDKKSGDLLGIKPLSKSVEIVTKGTVDGLGTFLGFLCLPMAEEFGLLFRDKVRNWRNKNIAAIENSAKIMYTNQFGTENKTVHPQIINSIVENGSWSEDSIVQKMWAGLLISACSSDTPSQENIIYINYLNKLTHLEAVFIQSLMKSIRVFQTKEGFIYTEQIVFDRQHLYDSFQTTDLQEIDFHLDHLRESSVLGEGSGFNAVTGICKVTLSAIGLSLLAKCSGFNGTAKSYFKPPIKEPYGEAIESFEQALA